MQKSKSTNLNSGISQFTDVSYAYCLNFTKKLLQMPLASFFVNPVDPKAAPGYSQKIKKPMNLAKVLKKLEENKYTGVDKWKEDINLVWNNAISYNSPETPLHIVAQELKAYFKIKTEHIPRSHHELWIKHVNKCHKNIIQMIELQEILEDQFKSAQDSSSTSQFVPTIFAH